MSTSLALFIHWEIQTYTLVLVVLVVLALHIQLFVIIKLFIMYMDYQLNCLPGARVSQQAMPVGAV